MPELPEVETIRSQLEKFLPLKIEKILLSDKIDSILHTGISLKNKTLIKIHRKGKMLDFVFDDETHLLSHLGMTGTWLVGKNLKKEKHTHLMIKSHEITFAYDDPRRFGHMYYLDHEKAQEKLNQLGYDLTDSKLDEDYLKMVLKKYPNRKIKVLLLDQKWFAGSGNYIANEICARAGIRPTRPAGKITLKEISKIKKAMGEVLNPALKSGGTTFQGGYRDTTGEKGSGVTHLVVFYQKTCQLCKKSPVKKIILAQRGTYYCPQCQK